MKNFRAGSVAVIAVLAVAGVVVSTALRPQRSAPDGKPAPSTTTVTRGDLTVTQTVDGSVGFGSPVQWLAALPGTLTSLPAVGTTIGRGRRLYAVDARPVVLMLGELPAYRSLQSGVRGADVRQLEENLRALGYGGFTVDVRFTSSTTQAVRRWQRDLGLPQTGVVELGRVMFWPHPVRIAATEAVLGQAVTAGAVLGTHTDTIRSVVAELELELAELARPGSQVRVTVPGRPPLTGTVSSVGSSLQTAATGQSPPDQAVATAPTVTITVTIADQTRLAGITGAPAAVQLVGERRRGVLTVPVGALLALREGGYGLEVVDGGETRIVTVQTGLFAAGRVEVSGTSLTPGLRVGTAAG
jgi:peptidoglycan hydrolase-like protein with peptidoglycan-binding domain